MMQIFIGADHGGFELKEALVEWLKSKPLATHDVGIYSKETCDYPLIAIEVAKRIEANPQSFGILICTSGIGMCITANRFKHIRAALVQTPEMAKLARAHNHINVLCLAGTLSSNLAFSIAQTFLTTFPSQDARHLRRLAIINAIEFQALSS